MLGNGRLGGINGNRKREIVDNGSQRVKTREDWIFGEQRSEKEVEALEKLSSLKVEYTEGYILVAVFQTLRVAG